MTLNIIDRRCTVNVQPTPQGYAFQYGDKTYRRSTKESLHDFFLEQTSFDTVKLRFPNEKYYIHLTLDEPEEFFSKNALRRVLSQESQGAWIEEKNGKQRYFIDNGWVFSRIEEVSEEEFFSKPTLSLLQKVASFVGTVALGALALGSKMPYRTSHASSIGFVSGALFQAACVSNVVLAQMPVGREFKINTYVTNSVSFPTTARLEGGSFVTVWASDQTGDDDIYAQIFNATGGPIGSEFRCNTNVTGSQGTPAVAGLLSGGFVTVWRGGQTGNRDIYAQIFNATGGPIGSELRCNSNVTDAQDGPAVAVLEGGNFVVVWEGYQSGSYDIYAQIINAIGGFIGSEFRCNTNRVSSQYNPVVTGLEGGGFVTAWYAYVPMLGSYNIFVQIFNATGGTISSEFRYNTNVTDSQDSPVVARLEGGGFVMVWIGRRTGDSDIYARIFNSTDGSIGSEFRCNTNTTGAQGSPAVTGLPGGVFVVVWEGYQTADANIYARIFNSTDGSIGSEFRCNTNTTGAQGSPAVTGLLGDDFVMVWVSSQIGNSDIYGQRYEISDNFMLNFSQASNDSSYLVTTVIPPSSTPQVSSLTQTYFPSSSSSSSFISLPSTSLPTTMLVSASSSPQPSASFLSITNLSYETTYSITVNGLDVGSFIFQGGTGLIDGTQSNTIILNIDAGLVGETLTLFNIPAGQEGQFETIELVGQSCQSFESQIVQDGGSQVFQVILQQTTCALAARPAAEFFPTSMLRV